MTIQLPACLYIPHRHTQARAHTQVCLESWENPWHMTTLPPLPLPPFPSWMLPFLLCAQNCLMFGSSWKNMVRPLCCCVA